VHVIKHVTDENSAYYDESSSFSALTLLVGSFDP